MVQLDKTVVKELLDSGKTKAEISRILNCNSGKLWFFCEKNNLLIKTNNDRKILIKNKDKILKLYNDGKSIIEISKIINYNCHSIYKLLRKNGIVFQTTFDNNNLIKDKTNEIIELYKNGLSARQISILLGCGNSTAWSILNRNGYETRQKTYNVDINFFKKIDSSEKAYILGMMYSDGNVYKNRSRITLWDIDVEILIKISKILKYEGPLTYREARNKKCRPQYTLTVCRAEISKDLINLGCIPNKSLILKFPTTDIVPIDLTSHFIRGVFDGDGSISKNSCSITGSYNFIYGLKNFIEINNIASITNIYQRYKNKIPEKTAHSLYIGRKEESIKFLNYIYKDHNGLCIDRKMQRYTDIIG